MVDLVQFHFRFFTNFIEERSEICFFTFFPCLFDKFVLIKFSFIFVIFIYNLKQADVSRIVRALRALDIVEYVDSSESSKYDLSKIHMAPNQIPPKYYNIRGQLK